MNGWFNLCGRTGVAFAHISAAAPGEGGEVATSAFAKLRYVTAKAFGKVNRALALHLANVVRSGAARPGGSSVAPRRDGGALDLLPDAGLSSR